MVPLHPIPSSPRLYRHDCTSVKEPEPFILPSAERSLPAAQGGHLPPELLQRNCAREEREVIILRRCCCCCCCYCYYCPQEEKHFVWVDSPRRLSG